MYVPTNHLYIGDVFLINSNDVIRPNLSVREGIGKLWLYPHGSFFKTKSLVSFAHVHHSYRYNALPFIWSKEKF